MTRTKPERTFARHALPMCLGALTALVLRLEAMPETRKTIVQAVARALALVDFQAAHLGVGGWHRACEESRHRLVWLGQLVPGAVTIPESTSLDAANSALLGTRGKADPAAAERLADHLTRYLHFDPADRDLSPSAYCDLIVEVMSLLAAIVFHAHRASHLTPEAERGAGDYQLAVWEAYHRLYGQEETP
jgi:hypothetical protein